MSKAPRPGIRVVYTSRLHVIFIVTLLYLVVGPPIGSLFVTVPIPSMEALFIGFFFSYFFGYLSALAVGVFAGIVQATGKRVPVLALIVVATIVGITFAMRGEVSPARLAATNLWSLYALSAAMHIVPALACWHLSRNIVVQRPAASNGEEHAG